MPRRIIVLTLAIGALTGCSTTPTAEPPPAQVASPAGEPIDSGTVGRMVDQMAQAIVNELPMTPEVANSEYRQYLAIGPVRSGGFTEPRRFETALESLRTKTMQNSTMRANFDMISTQRTEADAVMTELAGGSLDRYTDPLTGDAANRIDPRDLFLMTGHFQRFDDGPTRKAYRLMVFVERPQSRTRVWSHEFERRFLWDEVNGRWRAIVN